MIARRNGHATNAAPASIANGSKLELLLVAPAGAGAGGCTDSTGAGDWVLVWWCPPNMALPIIEPTIAPAIVEPKLPPAGADGAG